MQKSRDEIEIGKLYQSILNEEMTAGGVYGGEAGAEQNGIANTDWFAPNDQRNPYGLGVTTRKGKLKPVKRTRKRRKSAR